MERIKIVHLVEDLKVGGLEKIIASIVTALDKEKFEVMVWCLVKGGGIYDKLKAQGIKTEILNMHSSRDIFFLLKLRRLLKREKIQIAHIHGKTANTVARIAAVLARVPVIIIHLHTTYLDYTRRQLLINKILNFFTAKIICCSQAVADFTVKTEKVKKDKICVIYNGVKIEDFSGVRIKSKESQTALFSIGCVASLFPHKGHKYLLEALQILVKTAPFKVKLFLAGDGILRGELENYAASLGIASNVVFLGNVADVRELFKELEAAVLASSEREGLGIALLEAMAGGLAVIGTAIGGIPEVIKHEENGLLVPAKDAQALADALRLLADDYKMRQALGEKAKEITREKFSLEAMMEKIEALYLGLYERKDNVPPLTKKEKYNILFTSSFATLQGGGQRSLLLLLKYLDKNRFVPYLNVPEEGELSQEARKLEVKILVFPFPRMRTLNIFSALHALRWLNKIVKTCDIDLIHTESPREAVYAGIIGKLSNIPLVLHLRVSDSKPWVDAVLYVFTDLLLAVSHAVAGRFSKFKNKNKMIVIYNGVELEALKPSERNESREKLRIGYFGRIHRRKGIEVLLKAVHQVAAGVSLIIRGSGDEEYLKELRAMAEGLEVEFLPYRPEIFDEIAAVDAVVLPCFYGEGLPRVVIEAMALGKLVIVSDMAANREAVGKELEEYIFPPGDITALAAILKKIIMDRTRVYAKKALMRKRAEQFFDIRSNTKRIEAGYESLLR